MLLLRSVVLTLGLGLAAMTAFAGPTLVFEERTYDFGQIIQGDSVEHAFVFSNRGDQPLLINRVRSSCGCTAVLAYTRELQPGSSGEIKATFNSTQFRGPVSKQISIYSNDLQQPVAKLTLKGVVKELVKITPAQLNFGAVSADQQTTLAVTLLNQSSSPVTFAQLTTTAAELSASFESEELAPGEQTLLQVSFRPNPDQARFSGYVIITLGGPQAKELRIPVYAMLK